MTGHALRRVNLLALGHAALARRQSFAIRGTNIDVPGGDVGLRDRLPETRLGRLGLGGAELERQQQRKPQRADSEITRPHF